MKKIAQVKYDENLEFKYTNGAFGSFNANGDFTVNFFFDAPKNIESFTINIEENGQIHESVDDNGDNVRKVHTQLIMNMKSAESLAQWILSNIKHYNEFVKDQKK